MLLSDNPRLNDAAKKFISGLRFEPFVVKGEPVQVISRFTMPFKTVRPAGIEAFDSARNYFEKGRKVTSPAFSGAKPYELHAAVQINAPSGVIQGEYSDTWKADKEWKREVRIGPSYFARSRDGEKFYRIMNRANPDLPPALKSAAAANFTIAGFVLDAIEPIPPTDDFYEADWRIRRENVDDVRSIRVLRGNEPPNGGCDSRNIYAFWFDSAGRLIRFCERVDVHYSDFKNFNGAQVPQHISVMEGEKTLVSIQIDGMRLLDHDIPNNNFDLPSAPSDHSFTTAIEAR